MYTTYNTSTDTMHQLIAVKAINILKIDLH